MWLIQENWNKKRHFPGFVCDNKNNNKKLALKFHVVLELGALKQGISIL